MANYYANSGEFHVNTYTTDNQSWSDVTALSNGGFVVTWQSDMQDGSDYGIYGQRYNANGYRVGSEFRINSSTANGQGWSSVSALSDGGFVVTWDSYGQDGDDYGVYGQRYNANGILVGNEFRANTCTADSQELSSVAALSGGGFVVTWESYGQDGSSDGVYGQRYNASGNCAGGEFRVNTHTTGNQNASSVAALSAGGFVVTWNSSGQDGSGLGVYGQRYSASGNRAGGEFRVNTHTTGNQNASSVAALSAGGFIVTWNSSGQDNSGSGIYGQRYNANGYRVGGEFQVNTHTTGYQTHSSVTALSNGGFVVVWESDGQDGSSNGIYGQRYNANGFRVGSEFQVNTYTMLSQDNPSVTALRDGGFVVAWESDGQDGSDDGIYSQRYRADGTPYRNFTGTAGNDTWTGGSGNDTISGQGGNDSLYGGAGNDIINGGDGIDTMSGGPGNDIYYVDALGDVIWEAASAGIDTVHSSVTRTLGGNQEVLMLTGSAAINGTGNDLNNTLTGNGAANILDGMAGNDILLGKSGDDVLLGRAGSDTISGGANDDVLFGRDGNDALTGGSGSDVFVFDCTLDGTSNKDIVTDFSHTDDTIRLDKNIFTKFSTGTLLSSQFRASAAGTASDRNDFFLYNTSTGALLYDADGNGDSVAIQFATLTNQPQDVAFNDFVVVA